MFYNIWSASPRAYAIMHTRGLVGLSYVPEENKGASLSTTPTRVAKPDSQWRTGSKGTCEVMEDPPELGASSMHGDWVSEANPGSESDSDFF